MDFIVNPLLSDDQGLRLRRIEQIVTKLRSSRIIPADRSSSASESVSGSVFWTDSLDRFRPRFAAGVTGQRTEYLGKMGKAKSPSRGKG